MSLLQIDSLSLCISQLGAAGQKIIFMFLITTEKVEKSVEVLYFFFKLFTGNSKKKPPDSWTIRK